MTQALLLNFGILVVIGLTLVITGNPLILFALLLLKDLPFGLLLRDDEDDEPAEAKGGPMGFI